MAVTVTHSTPADGTFSAAGAIAWDANHTLTGLGTGVETFLGTPSSANLASAVTDETGTGALVFANTPTLVTPVLGTPTSGTLTNCTGLPVSSGISGFGTGVATFLATPSSANLRSALTDETGTGAAVFASMPTFVGTKETVYTITDGAAFEIDPANGGVQIVTLGASRTPAATNFAAGQSVLLGIDDGTAYTITWTTVSPTWLTDGGVAPTLATSGYTWIVLFKVSSTIYAARIA